MVKARPKETSAPASVSPTREKINPKVSSIRMEERTKPIFAPIKQISRAIMVKTRFFLHNKSPATPAITVESGRKKSK
jgi:hypothetical protein